MNVYHIVPTAHLYRLTNKEHQVCITAQAIEDQEYRKWYAEHNSNLILNTEWYGNGSTEGQVSMLIDQLKPTSVVLPYEPLNSSRTQFKTNQALKKFKGLKDFEGNFIGVPQGKNRKDWLSCLKWFTEHEQITTIALSRSLDTLWGYGGRLFAASYLSLTGRVNTAKQYILLGIETDPTEIFYHAQMNLWINGVVTALPFQAGYQGFTIGATAQYHESKPHRPLDYFNLGKERNNLHDEIIRYNIQKFEQWAGGSYD